MFDVNDDMDELFRRAADSYPLKTDTSDWQQVEQKLAATEPDKPAKAGVKNKSWFLLLLLLPLAWICNNYSHKFDKELAKSVNLSTKNIQPLQKNDKNITNKGDNSPTKRFTKKQINRGAKYQAFQSHNTNPLLSTLSTTRKSTLNINSKKQYSGNSKSSNSIASAEVTNNLTGS